MKKFHVEIKDNETGKMVVSMESDAFIGAFHEDGHENGKGRVQSVSAARCGTSTVLGVILGVKEIIDSFYKEYPELKRLTQGVSLEKIEEKVEKEGEEKTEPSDRPDIDKALKALEGMREVLDKLNSLKQKAAEPEEEDPFEKLFKRMFL